MRRKYRKYRTAYEALYLAGMCLVSEIKRFGVRGGVHAYGSDLSSIFGIKTGY